MNHKRENCNKMGNICCVVSMLYFSPKMTQKTRFYLKMTYRLLLMSYIETLEADSYQTWPNVSKG